MRTYVTPDLIIQRCRFLAWVPYMRLQQAGIMEVCRRHPALSILLRQCPPSPAEGIGIPDGITVMHNRA